MKKKIIFIISIALIMLCLLPNGLALAVDYLYNFDTLESEGDYNHTLSESNAGGTLNLTSSNVTDYVVNLEIGENSALTDSHLFSSGIVYFLDSSGSSKPNGNLTIDLNGKVFTLKSFIFGNCSGIESTTNLTVNGQVITYNTGSKCYTVTPASTTNITSVTISWDGPTFMLFDKFVIEPVTNPIITSQPGNDSIAVGSNTSFSVAALGTSLTYQWQVDTGSGFSNVTNGGVYSGASGATLSITGVTSGMNGYLYRCTVTNDGIYNTNSSSATLTILAQPPTDIELDITSIAENTASGTKVGGLTTTDPDSSSFTYSLVDIGSYPDNSSFTISGSDLLLNTIPNYEGKSSYSIRIQTQDGTGLTYSVAFTISITDANDAPTNISLSNESIAENSASGTTIGTLTGSDPDLPADDLTYSLPAGLEDNVSFSLSGNELKLAMVPDYEADNSYTVIARVNDGTLDYDKTFVITITNVNEAPDGLSLLGDSIIEHSAIGATVGTLTGTDPDAGAAFTYSLVAGAGDTDNASFTIAIDALKLGFVPDYETGSSYSIRVRVSDDFLTYDKQFTITIIDGNDPPTDITITGGSVAENLASGSTAGTLGSTDSNPGDTLTYSLAAGVGATDNASFLVAGDVLQFNSSADYETKNSYSVRIRSTDNNGLYFEKALVISITDVNEAPTGILLSNATIAENSASGTNIGTLSGIDPDAGATLSYSLPVGIGDNASFAVLGTSLRLAEIPDYEVKSSYSITVRVSDGEFTYDEAFTINISDANDTPTDIALSGSSSVLEHCAIATEVGTLSSTDQDGGSFTYTLVTGDGATDNAAFNISVTSLQVAVSPDFEVQDSYSIRIRTTDSTGLYYEKVFTVSVTDGDDPPTDITITDVSVDENTALGTTVGTINSVDTNGGPFIYSLVSGSGDTDNASFTIDVASLKLAIVPNYEVKNSYSIRVRTEDPDGFNYEKAFTITITNVNEAPIDIMLSNTSVAENTASETIVGTFTGIDVDAGTTFTYTLVAGAGDSYNSSFTISGNALKLAEVPDYETQTSYNIRIRVSDGELTYEEAFVIAVTDGNDVPTNIGLSSSNVVENTASGTAIASISSTDSNAGDTFTYALVPGTGSTDNSSFTIAGSDLKLAVTPDYETQTSYSIRLRTTDDGGMYYEKAFTINITDVNEAPTDLQLPDAEVEESWVISNHVGNFIGTDPDAASTLSYTLAAGIGDTDNAVFSITGDELLLGPPADYENKNSYSIRVRVTDNGGLYYEKQFIISVINVNEPPTDITISATGINENSTIGSIVGDLGATDGDTADTFTYTLASGSGATDNSSFTITGNQLQLAFVPDYEAKNNYSVRIKVTDAGGLSYEEAIAITIVNVNEAPSMYTITNTIVPENSIPSNVVGTLATTDGDIADTSSYSLVAGAGSTDNASFSILGNQLVMNITADYEDKNCYSIRIRATDAGGLFYEAGLAITISNVNEALTDLILSDANIGENVPVGTTIGVLSAIDLDTGDSFTYTLVTGEGSTDNASFSISNNELRTAASLDFETKPSYSIRIRVTDAGGLYYEKMFVITITDINDAPTNISLDNSEIVENSAVGTLVGCFTGTDADTGDSFTYTLVEGAGSTDNAAFTISDDELQAAISPDYEINHNMDIRIRVTDAEGLYYEKQFVITVNDVNEVPSDIAISSTGIAENKTIGATVGSLSGIDEDAADTLSYTLVSGIGSEDNDSFTITGNELKLAILPDYETKTSYAIRIRVTDAGGLYYEEQFTITITDINETPPAPPAPEPTPTPTVEKLTIDVTNGTTEDSVVQIEVERTTSTDGTITDSITFDENKAEETIERLEEEDAQAARIIAPESEEEIAEVQVTIPSETLSLLSDTDISLELETEAARISIPNASIEVASEEMQEDLYFRVTPLKDEEEKSDVEERAKKDGMLVKLMGSELSVIGTPMVIETNMPQTTVNIVLPLDGIIIPEAEDEREEFLSKLAVYVEHSDGVIEILRGEIVEYSEGVYGLSFNVSKFSTFTIIKDERGKSEECNVISVKTPSDTKINGRLIVSTVKYGTNSVKLNIIISQGASWKLYSDKACTKEIKNKTKLKGKVNKVYIKVTAEDGVSFKVYSVYIIRGKQIVN